MLKQEMLWKINTQGYKSAFTGWSFLLVIAAYCAMEFRGFFPRSDRPLINMVHVFLWYLNSRADGGSSFVKTEIPNPADYT
ncbi:cytochrome b561 [Escherichia coli]|uniref:Cytochrome b561 n=2 Tax=root TaxID=1 RepID=A0A2X1IVF2_ECOLX|nr:cytochrome b561 [Escherichia coli]